MNPEDLKISVFAVRQDGFMPTKKSGVEILHIPTGLSVSSTGKRSEYENRSEAMRLLAKALNENLSFEVMHHPV